MNAPLRLRGNLTPEQEHAALEKLRGLFKLNADFELYWAVNPPHGSGCMGQLVKADRLTVGGERIDYDRIKWMLATGQVLTDLHHLYPIGTADPRGWRVISHYDLHFLNGEPDTHETWLRLPYTDFDGNKREATPKPWPPRSTPPQSKKSRTF